MIAPTSFFSDYGCHVRILEEALVLQRLGKQVKIVTYHMGRPIADLDIVRTARARYDGRCRNPFNEYECGHWYARALSSYAMLQSLSGARYDAVDKTLFVQPRVAGDFRTFLCTATGYGTVGVKDGKPFVNVRSGAIDVKEMKYVPKG